MNRRVLLGAAILLMAAACGGGETPAPTLATEPPLDQPTEPPAQEGYQGGTVSDGGTISGTISYSGEIVGPIEVEVDKDNEICGDTIELSPIVRDGAGGLRDAVVRITDISSGKPLSVLGTEFVLDQKNCVYSPSVLIVPVGSAMTVLNSDGILHNVHTTPFDNAPLNVAQPGTQPEITSDPFTFPEVIPVSCDVHSWMNANVLAVDNPYAVLTGSDGSFILTEVPAGTYTVEIWHSELGIQTMEVTVEAGGTATINAEF
ncbi:MAG: DUF2012 domain-containing protein [Nitrospirae bacterium]|nr:DUF2012 domain-containing protein [Nitrospirota bacterium]